MKKLVIYYSFEGNTELIAKSIAEEVGADILRLKPKKDIDSGGFMKYFWGGRAVYAKSRPELLPFDKNPREYNMIFIGTPVWAWTYAPALNTFFAEYAFSGKKIALFCCHGGGKGKIFDKMKGALKGNEISGEIDFRDPLKNNPGVNIQKAKDWAKKQVNL